MTDEWKVNLDAQIQANLFESNSDEELLMDILLPQLEELPNEVDECKQWGGSTLGRLHGVKRDRIGGHERIMADYFTETPVYDERFFRRRFRMRRPLFLRIMAVVVAFDDYFLQKPNAAGLMGLSSIQKCTAALRVLAYGIAADATDEYVRLGASTAMLSMKRFCAAIRGCFQSTYLRLPIREDLEKQMAINSDRGFHGMFGSIDCIHWDWKNCPVSWQRQYQDKDGNMSIILEAIADQSLWIWHAYFGLPGCNNDITNVLDRSPMVQDMLQASRDDVQFVVNGTIYPRYYLLADGIYPKWSCFVQTIHEPEDEKLQHYAMMQESAHKDVERAFGVLQSRWAIISNPCKQWDLETIYDIMYACVILHNMIIEDEAKTNMEVLANPLARVDIQRGLTFEDLMEDTQVIENYESYFKLRGDLVEHLWQHKGDTYTTLTRD